MFYELKTFWSFGLYRLRSKNGIENFVNILSLAYSCSKIISLADSTFESLNTASPQDFKFTIGNLIYKELFFADFVQKFENHVISDRLFDSLDLSDFFDSAV